MPTSSWLGFGKVLDAFHREFSLCLLKSITQPLLLICQQDIHVRSHWKKTSTSMMSSNSLNLSQLSNWCVTRCMHVTKRWMWQWQDSYCPQNPRLTYSEFINTSTTWLIWWYREGEIYTFIMATINPVSANLSGSWDKFRIYEKFSTALSGPGALSLILWRR